MGHQFLRFTLNPMYWYFCSEISLKPFQSRFTNILNRNKHEMRKVEITIMWYGLKQWKEIDAKKNGLSSVLLVTDELTSILPKNHAGPVEKVISDFFRMPKNVGPIDSLWRKSHKAKGKLLWQCSYHGNDQIKILPPEACFPLFETWKIWHF